MSTSRRRRAAPISTRDQAVLRAAARRIQGMSKEQRVNAALAVIEPLLSLYAVVNDVFTEDDALRPAKRRMSLGRIYEEWKRCTAKMDPDYRDPHLTEDSPSLIQAARNADGGQFS